MSTKDVSSLLPGARERAAQTIAYARQLGIEVVVTSVVRSRKEQRELRDAYDACVAAGREGEPGVCQYPANRAGDSAHEYGFAWDSTPVKKEQMDAWIRVRKLFGWRVPNNDPVHAEVPRWRDALAWLRSHGFLPV